MDKIRGYKILRELTATSGTLYFAEKWGKRYVLKEFMRYRFPTEEGEECPEILRKVEIRTQKFYDRLRSTTARIRKKCREDGLLNVPLDIFREGKFIIKVTRQIEDCGVPYEELHKKLTPVQQSVLLKTALLQLDMLARIGFVHGDVKPENLMISRKGSVYSACIIDYDSGYFVGSELGEHVEHTPEYAAPEMLEFQLKMEYEESDEELQEAFAQVRPPADTYAMGCVFSYLLSGEALMLRDALGDPLQPGNQNRFGYPVQLPLVHPVWRGFLRRMVVADPALRCSPREVIDGVNASMITGAFKELTNPFAGLRGYHLRKEVPPMCRADMAIGQQGKKPVLLWHNEDCWQLKRTFRRQPRSVKALRKAHEEAFSRLERLSARVQKVLGHADIIRPFKIVRHGVCVFCLQQLPEGELLSLSALHTLMQPGQIDHLMNRLLTELQRCHQDGLICGVLDSNSLWVAKNGGQVQVVLTGTHRMLDTKVLPQSTQIDASPELLAPEIARYMAAMDADNRQIFAEMIGKHTDVFTMGLLYHLMLTGTLPEIADEMSSCYGMAAENDGIRLNSGLAPERAEIIRKMICFEPADRLPDCEAVIALIGAIGKAPAKKAPEKREPAKAEKHREAEKADTVESGKNAPKTEPAREKPKRPPESKPAEKLEPLDLPMEFLDIGDEDLWSTPPAVEDDNDGVVYLTDDEDPPVADDDNDGMVYIADDEDPPVADDDDGMVYIMTDEEEEALHGDSGAGSEEAAESEDDLPEIPELEAVIRVEGLCEHPNGFLKETGSRIENGENVLLRSLLPHEAQLTEQRGWHEQRRRAWNAVAQDIGLLPVKEIVRHSGVLYGVSDVPKEPMTWVDAAAEGVKQVTEWAIALLEQLKKLHARGLHCSLISPGELVFTGEEPDVQIRLHGFDHIRRSSSVVDARNWAAMLRERWIESECAAWAVDQPQCYLAPEAWENVFAGKTHALTTTADLFSFGVLLHVMLCGRLPVRDAENWRDAFAGNKVELDPEVPFAYRWLIGRLLKEDPRQRFPNCASVLEQLRIIQEQRDKRRSITIRRDGELVLDEVFTLYALADDGTEYCVDSAESNSSGRVTFRGYLPPEFTYEVRGDNVRQPCRWKLT